MNDSEFPQILWHHGTCDLCKAEFVLVCHFGYSAKTIEEGSYRICKNCLAKYIQYIIYGSHGYEDALLDGEQGHDN